MVEQNNVLLSIKISNLEKQNNRLSSKLEDLTLAPLGTILAWVFHLENNTTVTTNLTAGWQRCDGSPITAPSIWAGQNTPDLNKGRRFLRGGPDNEVLHLEEDQMQDHHHNIIDPEHSHVYKDKYPNKGDGLNGYWGPTAHDNKDDRWDHTHSSTSDKSKTGITVGQVASDYRKGKETRPKNMKVVYIMRVR